MPAGYVPGDARADPFASEKPLFSINGKNVDQYANKVTDGQKALLKKYPGYRLDIYPTHRTAAAPQWVYDNTFKNATRATITDGGYGVKGAFGGYPFPVPKSGYEVMWNQRLAFQGEGAEAPFNTWVVTSDGKRTLASGARQLFNFSYYKRDVNAEDFDGVYERNRLETNAPASKAGEKLVILEPLDASKPRLLWQYLVGQRRVRKAPSVAYDTPDFVTSGIGLFDEAFLFFGPFDRHEFKLIGKQEMFIPYNNNRAASAKVDDLVKPDFLNPDIVRWELHRVWVVEANLMPGKRHVVTKRRYYIDEDSWEIALVDGWDAQGQLWRTNYGLSLLAPDIPAVVNKVNWGMYNLQTGAYYHNVTTNELKPQYLPTKQWPAGLFTAEDLTAGAR